MKIVIVDKCKWGWYDKVDFEISQYAALRNIRNLKQTGKINGKREDNNYT